MTERAGSTARTNGIDVSLGSPRASASPALTEAQLFRGIGHADPVLVSLPCACGGDVTADPYAPARGVAAHQFTGRHKAWRQANDL